MNVILDLFCVVYAVAFYINYNSITGHHIIIQPGHNTVPQTLGPLHQPLMILPNNVNNNLQQPQRPDLQPQQYVDQQHQQPVQQQPNVQNGNMNMVNNLQQPQQQPNVQQHVQAQQQYVGQQHVQQKQHHVRQKALKATKKTSQQHVQDQQQNKRIIVSTLDTTTIPIIEVPKYCEDKQQVVSLISMICALCMIHRFLLYYVYSFPDLDKTDFLREPQISKLFPGNGTICYEVKLKIIDTVKYLQIQFLHIYDAIVYAEQLSLYRYRMEELCVIGRFIKKLPVKPKYICKIINETPKLLKLTTLGENQLKDDIIFDEVQLIHSDDDDDMDMDKPLQAINLKQNSLKKATFEAKFGKTLLALSHPQDPFQKNITIGMNYTPGVNGPQYDAASLYTSMPYDPSTAQKPQYQRFNLQPLSGGNLPRSPEEDIGKNGIFSMIVITYHLVRVMTPSYVFEDTDAPEMAIRIIKHDLHLIQAKCQQSLSSDEDIRQFFQQMKRSRNVGEFSLRKSIVNPHGFTIGEIINVTTLFPIALQNRIATELLTKAKEPSKDPSEYSRFSQICFPSIHSLPQDQIPEKYITNTNNNDFQLYDRSSKTSPKLTPLNRFQHDLKSNHDFISKYYSSIELFYFEQLPQRIDELLQLLQQQKQQPQLQSKFFLLKHELQQLQLLPQQEQDKLQLFQRYQGLIQQLPLHLQPQPFPQQPLQDSPPPLPQQLQQPEPTQRRPKTRSQLHQQPQEEDQQPQPPPPQQQDQPLREFICNTMLPSHSSLGLDSIKTIPFDKQLYKEQRKQSPFYRSESKKPFKLPALFAPNSIEPCAPQTTQERVTASHIFTFCSNQLAVPMNDQDNNNEEQDNNMNEQNQEQDNNMNEQDDNNQQPESQQQNYPSQQTQLHEIYLDEYINPSHSGSNKNNQLLSPTSSTIPVVSNHTPSTNSNRRNVNRYLNNQTVDRISNQPQKQHQYPTKSKFSTTSNSSSPSIRPLFFASDDDFDLFDLFDSHNSSPTNHQFNNMTPSVNTHDQVGIISHLQQSNLGQQQSIQQQQQKHQQQSIQPQLHHQSSLGHVSRPSSIVTSSGLPIHPNVQQTNCNQINVNYDNNNNSQSISHISNQHQSQQQLQYNNIQPLRLINPHRLTTSSTNNQLSRTSNNQLSRTSTTSIPTSQPLPSTYPNVQQANYNNNNYCFNNQSIGHTGDLSHPNSTICIPLSFSPKAQLFPNNPFIVNNNHTNNYNYSHSNNTSDINIVNNNKVDGENNNCSLVHTSNQQNSFGHHNPYNLQPNGTNVFPIIDQHEEKNHSSQFKNASPITSFSVPNGYTSSSRQFNTITTSSTSPSHSQSNPSQLCELRTAPSSPLKAGASQSIIPLSQRPSPVKSIYNHNNNRANNHHTNNNLINNNQHDENLHPNLQSGTKREHNRDYALNRQ